jgi:hypothetical protein
MAGKKPAKRNVTNTPVQTKVEEKGKAILYYGISGTKFSCISCAREFQKGMIYEHNNERYCSRRCIK